MRLKKIHTSIICSFLGLLTWAQDVAEIDANTFEAAKDLAYEGEHKSARKILKTIVKESPDNKEALFLLARTNSWIGYYGSARKEFNRITSIDRKNRAVWISAIKNELYSKNDATALGLANKALYYLEEDTELQRLRSLAIENVKNKKYPKLEPIMETIIKKKGKQGGKKSKGKGNVKKNTKGAEDGKEKKKKEKVVLTNRVGVSNSFTVFDIDRDAAIRTSIAFRKKTKIGSVIPKINYSNRSGRDGVQYDIDFYPKFSKTFYAYLNYGYSSSTVFPDHKLGGDLYANLPGPYEASGVVRYATNNNREVFSITNSLGMYKGNYYFSLRSYITPRPGNLTRFSGNLLMRKYFRNGENFMGLTVGMGYSPELRQLISGDEVLAETLLYIESQRLSFQYKFSPRKSANIYNTRLGITRQEIASSSGKFFWALTAGLTYQVKF